MSQTLATTRKRFPRSAQERGAPADRTAPFRAAPAQRLRPDLEADVGDVAGTAALATLASAARVGRGSWADLDALLDEWMLTPAIPELYVMQSPTRMLTIGMGKPFTVTTSGCNDLVTRRDKVRDGPRARPRTVRHAVYRTMMMHLLRLARSFGLCRLAAGAARNRSRALEWQRNRAVRRSRWVAVRAGFGHRAQGGDEARWRLPAGQAGLEAFLAQAREYETSGDMRDGVLAAQPGAADPSVLGAAGCRLDSLGGHRRLCRASRRVPASGRRRQRQIFADDLARPPGTTGTASTSPTTR